MRGRRYYDPEIQVPSTVPQAEDLTRVEIFQNADGRWAPRLVNKNGIATHVGTGSFNPADAFAEAERRWPGLEVFEVRDEAHDSTWSGTGPSPRAFFPPPQQLPPESGSEAQAAWALDEAITAESDPEPVLIHGLVAGEPGMYVRLNDVTMWLRQQASACAEERRAGPWSEILEQVASELELSMDLGPAVERWRTR